MGTKYGMILLFAAGGCAEPASKLGDAFDTEPTTGEETVGDAGTEDGETSEDSTGEGTEESDDGGTPKLDVSAPDVPGNGCEGECGNNSDFEYIWISNSGESTVSKLNTQTLVEDGRYLTRADAAGNPSRTSVSIDGEMATINNRAGGVLAVWGRPELCDPNKNGVPGLQTSSGADDVLAWNQDDCVAWYADFDDYHTQRPIAWTSGVLDEETCEFEQQKVWTSGCNGLVHSGIQVHRLLREDGSIDETVEVDAIPCIQGSFGGYGGAADAKGNFWISNLGSTLVLVDGETLDWSSWSIPANVYGITVDAKGRPWMASNMGGGATSAYRFDPDTETFDTTSGVVAGAQTGLAPDAEGRMWMNYWSLDGGMASRGVVSIDIDTMEMGEPIELQDKLAKGMSVDRDGFVWSIALGGPAYRIDPGNGSFDIYAGLGSAPYTYSDMTGGALTGVTCGLPEG